jgi:hypothetical protein
VTLQEQTTTPQLVPLNTPATLGPWTITVTEAVSGDQAIAMLNEKNPENPDPSELPGTDPGTSYILARITVQNTSAAPRVINLADFAATGTDGVLRRPPAIEVPDPALQTIVPAGETFEGIVPFLVDDPEAATVWFDSTILGGNWANGVFALGAAAAIPTFEVPDTSPSDAGDSPETAVEINEPVRLDGWEVTITEWAQGQKLWDLAESQGDYRSRALGDDLIPAWRGVYASVTNLGTAPATFPTDAFLVTDGTGEPWDNVVAATMPVPEVHGELLPGASREGWAGFNFMWGPAGEGAVPEIPYVRIQINHVTGNVRYVVIDPDAIGTTAEEEETATPETTSAETDPLDVAVGDIVVVVNEIVNLRSEPSTTGEKIKEIPIGTELEITGDPVEADGYRWYPVKEVDGDGEGFVVQDYIEVAP